jgi:hypothetical protein
MDVQWDVPVQPLESAAAAARESGAHMHAQGEETSSTLSHSLFSSLEILRQAPFDRWDAKRSCWQRCHCVLTRSGFLHTCEGTAAAACRPLESVALVKYIFDGVDKDEVTFYMVRKRDGWFGARGPRQAFRAAIPKIAAEWIADIRGQMALWDKRTTTNRTVRQDSVGSRPTNP